jgi:hypothetical protein
MEAGRGTLKRGADLVYGFDMWITVCVFATRQPIEGP